MDRLEASNTALLERAAIFSNVQRRPALAAAIVALNIEHMVTDKREPDFIADWLDRQDGSFIDQNITQLDDAKLRQLTPVTIGEVQAEIERLLSLEGARHAYNVITAKPA